MTQSACAYLFFKGMLLNGAVVHNDLHMFNLLFFAGYLDKKIKHPKTFVPRVRAHGSTLLFYSMLLNSENGSAFAGGSGVVFTDLCRREFTATVPSLLRRGVGYSFRHCLYREYITKITACQGLVPSSVKIF